jgi:hypothetical protein
MRGAPDHGPLPPAAPYDVLGVAVQLHDRVAYCRCALGGLQVAYVVQLQPLIVFSPDTNQYTHVFDSRQVIVVDCSPVERAVRKALRGIGLES